MWIVIMSIGLGSHENCSEGLKIHWYTGELWPGKSKQKDSVFIKELGEFQPGKSKQKDSGFIKKTAELWPGKPKQKRIRCF